MSSVIKLVQGDSLRPQVQATITDDNTGNIVNITGATCLLKFRAVGATVLTDTISGTVLNGTAGTVVFPMSALSMAGPPGDYEGQIQITFPSGTGIQSVYNSLRFRLTAEF